MIVSDAVLRAGADLFGYEPATLTSITHGGAPDGAVYDETTPDSSAFIVKFIPTGPEKLPAIREKISFVAYLRDGGVNVPDLVRSRNNNLVETVNVDNQHYAITRMVKAPGHTISFEDDWGPAFWERWGRTIGHIHRLSQAYEAGSSIITWEEEHAFFANLGKDDPEVTDKWLALAEQLNALPRPTDAYGLIHNDAHVFNFLIDGDNVTILDFDVCAWHWFVLDIAIPWFHTLWEQNRYLSATDLTAFARSFSQHWLAGYRAENTLDDVWLERLPLFARYRQFLFFIGMWKFSGELLSDVRTALLADAPLPGFDAVVL